MNHAHPMLLRVRDVCSSAAVLLYHQCYWGAQELHRNSTTRYRLRLTASSALGVFFRFVYEFALLYTYSASSLVYVCKSPCNLL